MSKEESQWDFWGRKIGLDDSSYGDNKGHIFYDSRCLKRFQMEIKINVLIVIKKYLDMF